MATIYDAKTSFNYYIRDALNLYDSNINVFFQPNQNICYPAVIVRHLITAELNDALIEFQNPIEINVIYQDNKDKDAILTCQHILDIFSFSSRSVMNFINIPLYDHTLMTLQKLECLRVCLERGSGFRYIPSEDPNIRHYQIDLVIKYKI